MAATAPHVAVCGTARYDVAVRDIQDLGQETLAAWCVAQGEAPYRAGQVLAWVHRRGVARFEDMDNLPRRLRTRLAEEFAVGRLEPARIALAGDGTRKMVFHLEPGAGGRPAAVETGNETGAPIRRGACRVSARRRLTRRGRASAS